MTNQDWDNWDEVTEKKSDFLKWKVGATRIRILTKPVRVNQLSKGIYPHAELLGMVEESYVPKADENVNVEGWSWAINREDNQPCIVKFGQALRIALKQLKENDDYRWDSFPMPFDITINNTGNGANRYSIVPSPKRTEESLSAIKDKKSIEEIIQKIKDKKGSSIQPKQEISYPTPEAEGINPDDIPF